MFFCSVQTKQQSTPFMACTQLKGSLHVHLTYHTMKSQVYNILLSLTSFWNDNDSNSKWLTRTASQKQNVSCLFVCKGTRQDCEKRVLLITYAAPCLLKITLPKFEFLSMFLTQLTVTTRIVYFWKQFQWWLCSVIDNTGIYASWPPFFRFLLQPMWAVHQQYTYQLMLYYFSSEQRLEWGLRYVA